MSWIFQEHHDLFRRSARTFAEREIIPHVDEWEEQETIPRQVWQRLGELGYLGIEYDPQYGGAGADFITTLVFFEELARCRAMGLPMAVAAHTDMGSPHLYYSGSDEQKERLLPAIIRGEKVCAITVSEPGGGSDVAAIQTRARRDGDYYILNGSKTFITNGVYGDLYFAAVRTGEAGPGARHKGISVLMVEKGTPGFIVAKKLKKMGWWCSDTAELVFEECPVPAQNLLGIEGEGFHEVMKNFQRERLVTAVIAVAATQQALEDAMAYARQRIAFDRPIAKFQALRHRFAEMYTEVEAARHLTYYVSWLFSRGEASDREVSAAKLLTSEVANRVAYGALQVYGGYGYIRELPIERFYRDTRVLTIGAGTSEIMKEVIARRLDL
ncbi:MAG: acyl-CoA dehydrogenase family protein [Dehalococcoidia bacterium]